MTRVLFVLLAVSALGAAGCAHLNNWYSVGLGTPAPTATAYPTIAPTTNPSATPTGIPVAACATPDVTDTNVVYVAMSSDMTPATDANGAELYGYAIYNDADAGNPPQASAVVDATSSDLVQFINMEPLGSTLTHSAVGFAGSGFPATPYAFPTGSDAAIGATITASPGPDGATPWSTGEIQSPTYSTTGSYCASQPFTLPSSLGTYYFGDYDLYDTAASMRGELVVTSGSSSLGAVRAGGKIFFRKEKE